MSTTHSVRKGPLPPGSIEALVVRVSPGKLTDLSTVTSATFDVRLPGGTMTTWSTVLQNQSATQVDLVHIYGTHEIDNVGLYLVEVTLFVGAVPYRCDTNTTVLEVTP